MGRWLTVLILVAALAACGKPQIEKQESYVFGTRVEVQIWGTETATARESIAAVLREFDRLHHLLHAWQPSEITILNDAIARGQTRQVPPEVAALLREASAIAGEGEHLFNPAIGQLIRLWGFQSDTFKAVLPSEAQRAALVAADPRMSDLQIDGDRVGSRNPAVMVDLGGYAKGYALDRAATILRARGVSNALINIGGNVLALGTKGKTPWRVGIQHPRAPSPLATLDLADGEAIGTSGDYQRYFELDGVRYCHLIDPRSGAPAQGTQAVTVLIPPGAHAGTRSDALSKPLFIAGADRWRALARAMAAEAVLRVDAEGTIQVSAAMNARLRYEPGLPTPQVVD